MEGPKKVAPIMRDIVNSISEIKEIIEEYKNVDKEQEIYGIKFIGNPREIKKLENSIIIMNGKLRHTTESCYHDYYKNYIEFSTKSDNNLILYIFDDYISVFNSVTLRYITPNGNNTGSEIIKKYFQKNGSASVIFWV
jgi:hypothetical protein